jgi:hypothetical protein
LIGAAAAALHGVSRPFCLTRIDLPALLNALEPRLLANVIVRSKLLDGRP